MTKTTQNRSYKTFQNFNLKPIFFLLLSFLDITIGDKLPHQSLIYREDYNVHAFDCTNPLSIEYIEKKARCENRADPTPNSKLSHWDLLFHPSKTQYAGYKCSIIDSTITGRCGILSYTQLLDETVKIPRHISKETCAQIV